MPRYRVVLEFDHPGSGTHVDESSLTNSPDMWNWSLILEPDHDRVISNLEVDVYEKNEWSKIAGKSYG